MSTKKSTKGGYYTVEAAVFLPVFIIAVLTVGYLIKVVGAAEVTMHAATDEARYAASQAYVVKSGFGFSSSLEKRILADSEDISSVSVERVKYLFSENGMDGLISFHIKSRIDIRLPLHLYDGVDLEEDILCRGWIGKGNSGKPLGFDEMEKSEESRWVWIFPRTGEKYHRENCTFVSNSPTRMILDDTVKNRYNSCGQCKSKEVPMGSIIYCYDQYGEVYHKGSCPTVDKYVRKIQEKDAKAKGYSPCGKCGG